VDSIAEMLRESDAGCAREWLRSLRRAVHDPLLMEYLAWKYGGERLLARAGHVYPVVCYRARQTDVESVLGALDETPPASANEDAVSRLGLLVDPGLTEGDVYVMRRFSTGARLTVDCGLGRYFGMLDTCSAGATEAEPLPVKAYVQGMNAILPADVAVRAASIEPEGFDARRSASGKRYRYRIENDPVRAPLSHRTAWQVFRPLDAEAMRAAAVHLLGRHDFACFQAADCACEHAVREVRRCEVTGQAGGRIDVVLEATAFVKHMVRNITGTLVEVGLGKRAAGSIRPLLLTRDRALAGPTAPPQGLCLEEVFYDGRAAPAGSQPS